jgi:hypothetical protein
MDEFGNPSLAGSYESVLSLIDAGQRSGSTESNARLRGITSPTSRSESSFGCVVFRYVAVSQEPERSPPNLRDFAKPEGGCRRAHIECECRKTSVGE